MRTSNSQICELRYLNPYFEDLTSKSFNSNCREMADVPKAASDTLHAASPTAEAETYDDILKAHSGCMDVASSACLQAAAGLIWDKGDSEFLRSLHRQILLVIALEAAAKDCAGGAGAAPRTEGAERKKSVKWQSESKLVLVKFFEPVLSITDEEVALLEKVKDLPLSIQEFLLTETNLVVQGSKEHRDALVPRQSNCALRLPAQFRFCAESA